MLRNDGLVILICKGNKICGAFQKTHRVILIFQLFFPPPLLPPPPSPLNRNDVNKKNSCSSQVEACPSEVEDGYTSDYAPEVAASLAEPYETVLITGEDSRFIDTLFSLDCTLYVGE